MNASRPGYEPNVEVLIETIYQKLLANKGVLHKSVKFGRISWRQGKNGEIDVALELKL